MASADTNSIDAAGTESLVRQAQEGGVEAFRQLYELHAGRIYALCLRMTGNRTAAEEATQDAFVNAWTALPRFNGASMFSTWLHRIAVNAVLTAHRVKKRRSAVMQPDDGDMERFRALETDAATKMDLETAVAALPEKARHILVLFDIEGYSHEEIADALNISTGTSKSQLHRARKLVQEMMQ